MKIINVLQENTRVIITLENDEQIEIDPSDYFCFHIYERSEITITELNSILQNTANKKAKSEAIRLISYKLKTIYEVEKHLEGLDYNEVAVEYAVNYLKELRYLNDEDYAGRFARTKIKSKPISKKQLQYEMSQKGLSEDIIESALLTNTINEYDGANKLLCKKFSAKDLMDSKLLLKAKRYLYSKGYSFELIEKVISDIIEKLSESE